MTNKNGKQRECAIILDAATTPSLSLHSDSHGRFRKATGFTFTRIQPQPFPPRTEEEVKELKRRAALPNKLGGRCSLVTSNYVVFNPSAFALYGIAGCGDAWSLLLGVCGSECWCFC
ncbi:hypothetical protein CUC08_Gglean012743 [Alternaria sp. MG1]|nr:hypothetical protein CUC08_Gglean012743 [Alternaria sp. MG1]